MNRGAGAQIDRTGGPIVTGSSIAKNALNYIAERKLMLGGILWIQLKGVRDIHTLTKLIQRNIYDSLNLSRLEISKYARASCTYQEVIDFIVGYF